LNKFFDNNFDWDFASGRFIIGLPPPRE